MGYRLNCLDEPILIAVSKPLLTEFGIHHRLESCESVMSCYLVTMTSFCSQRGEGVKNGQKNADISMYGPLDENDTFAVLSE